MNPLLAPPTPDQEADLAAFMARCRPLRDDLPDCEIQDLEARAALADGEEL